jgi:uncharacterized repeat protein (TIGR01451 family)
MLTRGGTLFIPKGLAKELEMNTTTKLVSTAVIGTALAVSITSPALAWHPQGKIVKEVTNVTAGTAKSDANTAAQAVAAKPGDILTYTITLSNPAPAAPKQYNDLAFIKLKDVLPEGVELVKDPSLRTINEDVATIVPGKSVTKELTVKVTATKDMTIENKACFQGNSVVKDAPRSGCDTAVVKVTVPKTPVTPTEPGKGQETPTPAPTPVPDTPAPAELPKTGAASALAIGGFATLTGYVGSLVRLRNKR